MGVQGPKSFQNEAAMEWVSELAEYTDLAGAAEAIDSVMADKADYLDADVCQEGVAAAEVVAAAAGKPAADLPDEVKAWIGGKPKPDAALVAKTLEAMAAIREKSELREFWEDSEELAGWNTAMDELKGRLDAAKSAA